jgi:hypothetical protein
LAIAVAWAALAGCVSQRSDSGSTLKPSTNTMGDEAPDRLRARVHTELASSYFELGNIPVALEETKGGCEPTRTTVLPTTSWGVIVRQKDRLAEESFRRAPVELARFRCQP